MKQSSQFHSRMINNKDRELTAHSNQECFLKILNAKKGQHRDAEQERNGRVQCLQGQSRNLVEERNSDRMMLVPRIYLDKPISTTTISLIQ